MASAPTAMAPTASAPMASAKGFLDVMAFSCAVMLAQDEY
jgi:hypothetical protein